MVLGLTFGLTINSVNSDMCHKDYITAFNMLSTHDLIIQDGENIYALCYFYVRKCNNLTVKLFIQLWICQCYGALSTSENQRKSVSQQNRGDQFKNI